MLGKTVSVEVIETITYEVEVPVSIAREGEPFISEYCLSELSLTDIEATAYVSDRSALIPEVPDLEGEY